MSGKKKQKKGAANAAPGLLAQPAAAASPGSPRRAAAAAKVAIAAEASGNDASSHAVRDFLKQRQRPSQLGVKLAAAAARKREREAAARKRKRAESLIPTDPPVPSEDEDDAASSSAVSSSDDEAGEHVEEPDAKRQRSSSPSPPLLAAAASERVICVACAASILLSAVASQPFCPACDLIHTSPEKSGPNQLRLARLQTAAACSSAASSSVHSSQLDTSSKPKLGSYESELRRLLENAGDPFPRFQSQDSIDHEAAITELRKEALGGTSYAHQSPWLTKLIRSGTFKELSLALPRSNVDALRQRAAEAKGSKVFLVGAAGELMSSAETHVERNLTSLTEFLKVLIVSVLPSLFDRPRASLDWLELARSAIEITEREPPPTGWAIANRYLVDLLNDRVSTRLPFNSFDMQILQTVRSFIPPASQAAGGAPGAAPARPVGDSPQQRFTNNVCRDWNNGNCDKSPCKYRHQCFWAGCANPLEGHRGKDCPSRYPAQQRFQPPTGGQRQQRPAAAHQRK